MSEAHGSAITTEDLREAIQTRISEGVRRRDVSLLITTYAQPGPFAGRLEDGLQRLPVELIPVKCRCEFLAMLCQLDASSRRADVIRKSACHLAQNDPSLGPDHPFPRP
jgi:hypothetical protein